MRRVGVTTLSQAVDALVAAVANLSEQEFERHWPQLGALVRAVVLDRRTRREGRSMHGEARTRAKNGGGDAEMTTEASGTEQGQKTARSTQPPEDLAALVEKAVREHRPHTDNPHAQHVFCPHDMEPWPCKYHRILAALRQSREWEDRLRTAVLAYRDEHGTLGCAAMRPCLTECATADALRDALLDEGADR